MTNPQHATPWQGSVPAHWTIQPISSVLTRKKKKLAPELPLGSISFGEVVFKKADSIPDSTRATYQEVLPGDVLVNPLNLNFDLKSLRIALSAVTVCVSPGYFVMRPRDTAHPQYLAYVLREFDVKHMKTLGAGIRQTVTYDLVSREMVAMPPLAEQAAIADYLDIKTAAIDALIAKKEQLVRELRAYEAAVIAEAVAPREGWPQRRLKHAVTFNPRLPSNVPDEALVSFLPMDALSEFGSVDMQQTRPVASVKAGYTYFADGDIAYAKVTPCFENGKGAVFAALQGGVGFGTTEITVLRPRDGYDTQFLAYVVQGVAFKERGRACMEGAGGLKRVPEDDMKVFEQGFPSLSEQALIATRLGERIEGVRGLCTKSLEVVRELRAYRAALIAEAVTGKLELIT